MTTTKEAAGLERAILRAEEWAGTMPAKEAVKLRPADWHAVCKLGREAAQEIRTLHTQVKELRRERDEAHVEATTAVTTLSADRNSWRRVAEQFQGEKQAAEARATKAEADAETLLLAYNLELEAQEKAEAGIAEAVNVCEPFVEIRDQELSEMIKLIRKPVDDFALVSVSVTKRQFLDARAFVEKHKDSRT